MALPTQEELASKIAELSAQASELGATNQEIEALGGTTVASNNTSIADTAFAELAPLADRVLDTTRAAASAGVDTSASNPVLAAAASAPAPSSAKLKAAQEAIEATTVKRSESIAAIEESMKSSTAATNVAVQAIQDAAAANQVMTLQADTVDMQAQNNTIDAFEAAGGVEFQTQIIRDLKADGERVAGLLDERADILDDEHTGIQIIDGIINDFRVAQTDININAAVAQRQSTTTQLQNFTLSTESANRTNALTKKTINAATIQANQSVIANTATIQAKNAEITNLHANATTVATIANMDAAQTANVIQGYRLEGEAEQRAIAKEAQVLERKRIKVTLQKLDLAIPQAELAMEQLRLQIADMKDPARKAALLAQREEVSRQLTADNNAREILVEDSQKGQSALFGVFEDSDVIARKLSDPVTKQKYLAFGDIGRSGRSSLGNDYSEAKATKQFLDPLNNAPASKTTELFNTIDAKIAEDLTKLGANIPKTAEAVKAHENKIAEDTYDAWAIDVAFGDDTNPMQAPPMATLGSKVAVQQDFFYKELVAPKGFTEANPQALFDLGVAGMLAKTVTAEQVAAGIVTMFTAAAAHNSSQDGGFTRVGLPDQTTYITKISRQPTFFEQLKSEAGILFGSPAIALGLIGKSLTDQTAEDVSKTLAGIRTRLISLDLMDVTKVTEHLIKLRSATAPVPAITQSSEPATGTTTVDTTTTSE